MQEEADLDVFFAVANLLPKHLREQHQVVVMYPDQIPIFDLFRDGLCEQTIRFLVCIPGGLIERNLSGVVMEQRPKNGI